MHPNHVAVSDPFYNVLIRRGAITNEFTAATLFATGIDFLLAAGFDISARLKNVCRRSLASSSTCSV